MPAVDRWRFDLEGWALPPELLDAVDDSPYEWPSELFKRMRRRETDGWPTPTARIVHQLASEAGSVLDIGAGTGRASLPLTLMGHRVTAVERDEGMAFALRQEAKAVESDITLIIGSWPQVAGNAGVHDVVMSANVVYDVAEIEPFVDACHRMARRGVVIELTRRHPWHPLAGYYRTLHGIDRPEGPSADLFVEVVRDVTGVKPVVERWTRPPSVVFETSDELFDFYMQRLVVPSSRRSDLEETVGPDIVEDADGWIYLGDSLRDIDAVWWGIR